MIKINNYFATFYGNLNNVREDICSLAENDPRCVETGNMLMISFRSAMIIQEISDYLNIGDRLFVVQLIDESNFKMNLSDELNTHLIFDESRTTEDPQDIKISSLDKDKKKEMINTLLENYGKLSVDDKIMLEKLSKEDE